MTTALDTNVVIALWEGERELSLTAQASLDAARGRGPIVASAPVFAELLAGSGRDPDFVERFFGDTHVAVEWELSEAVWRMAGKAFGAYAARRVRGGNGAPRRSLADFVIGAHAVVQGYTLLTLDQGLYAAAFPKLALVVL